MNLPPGGQSIPSARAIGAVDRGRALGRLLRWLGPWADEARAPLTDHHELTIPVERAGDRPIRVVVHRPRDMAPLGALLLVPGLHYLGHDDPRLDRFARIVAHAGVLVFAPYLPDFLELRVDPRLVRDTERSLDALLALEDRPAGVLPGIFSISFGSMPALRVAAQPSHAERIGGVVVFGGYADWGTTIQFCLKGGENRPHDPLNRPALFLNLLEHMDHGVADVSAVVDAWWRYVRSTWGKSEMKDMARVLENAQRHAEGLADDGRALFLKGCGALAGGEELCDDALRGAGSAHDFLDPKPHLHGIRRKVVIVHGRDDDVIPFEQAASLKDALPHHAHAEVLLTGLYAHTGKPTVGELLRLLPASIGELRAMAGILDAIVNVATTAA